MNSVITNVGRSIEKSLIDRSKSGEIANPETVIIHDDYKINFSYSFMYGNKMEYVNSSLVIASKLRSKN